MLKCKQNLQFLDFGAWIATNKMSIDKKWCAKNKALFVGNFYGTPH